MTEHPLVDHETTTDTFSLLTHETRVRTLEAVADEPSPVSRDRLQEVVGVDSADRLDYHLDKLEDRLVRAESEGYQLTEAGRRIVGALRSVEYTFRRDDPIETGTSCLNCDAEVLVELAPSSVRMSCSECGFQYTDMDVSPGAFSECAPEDLTAFVARQSLERQALANEGICHVCGGRIEGSTGLVPAESMQDWYDSDEPGAVRRYECRHCGQSWQTMAELVLLARPAMVAFHYDHGVDVRDVPWWEIGWVGSETPTVRNRDPFQLELSVRLDDEVSTLLVDEEFSVINEHRRTVGGE